MELHRLSSWLPPLREVVVLRTLSLLSALLPPWKHPTNEGTTNVFIHLPQCESCAEVEDPTPHYVDYEHQSMTFVVNKKFKERVRPTTPDMTPPESDETNDEENTE
jgi:hypothetical protein